MNDLDMDTAMLINHNLHMSIIQRFLCRHATVKHTYNYTFQTDNILNGSCKFFHQLYHLPINIINFYSKENKHKWCSGGVSCHEQIWKSNNLTLIRKKTMFCLFRLSEAYTCYYMLSRRNYCYESFLNYSISKYMRL